MKNKLLYTVGLITAIVAVNISQVFAATGTVKADTLKLRAEASTNSSIVELLDQGKKVEIVETQGDWYKVNVDGKTGYVSKQYIEADTVVSDNKGTETDPQPTNDSNPEEGAVTKTKLKSNSKVRVLPVINSNLIQEIKEGTEVEVICKTNKWVFIQTDVISGWIPRTAVDIEVAATETTNNQQPETTQSEPVDNTNNTGNEISNNNTANETKNNVDSNNETATSKLKYVNSSSVYVRSKAGTDGDIIATLLINAEVYVTGEEGEWCKIKYNDKINGYIRKDLLSDNATETTSRGEVDRYEETNKVTEEVKITNTTTIQESTNSLGQSIVSKAQQYLGCPYVYGASGSTSFDCSGFTMYIYKQFGISLPHGATSQSKYGTEVSKENLQPGDLVFFLDYETMNGIGHCGIYIGNGDFIHASSGSGNCVKISTLLSGSYKTRYYTARRLL